MKIENHFPSVGQYAEGSINNHYLEKVLYCEECQKQIPVKWVETPFCNSCISSYHEYKFQIVESRLNKELQSIFNLFNGLFMLGCLGILFGISHYANIENLGNVIEKGVTFVFILIVGLFILKSYVKSHYQNKYDLYIDRIIEEYPLNSQFD